VFSYHTSAVRHWCSCSDAVWSCSGE